MAWPIKVAQVPSKKEQKEKEELEESPHNDAMYSFPFPLYSRTCLYCHMQICFAK